MIGQEESEATEPTVFYCDRCGERPADRLVDGNGVCDECRESLTSNVLELLRTTPAVRELSLFIFTLAGAISIYSGMLEVALVMSAVVAVLLVLPRHYDEVGE